MAQFNEYRIWLTIDGDTYAMHDYNGDDLVRANSLTKTETLHRDLDPVQDKAEFTLDWRQSLANKLITTSPVNKVDDTTYEPNIITCEIHEKRPSDSEWYAWFYGYVRPVEEWNIDQDDQTISIEVLDNSRKLEKTSPGYSTVRDRTFHEIVEDFLEDAGYNSTERELVANFTPSGVANATLVSYSLKADEKTFKEAISELILPFGYVYRFNAAGQFELVRWITEDNDTDGTVNEENMVGSLKVDRDSARAGWEPVKTGASKIEIEIPEETTATGVMLVSDSSINTVWKSGDIESFTLNISPDTIDLPDNAEDVIEVRYRSVYVIGKRREEDIVDWPWSDPYTWYRAVEAFRLSDSASTNFSDFTGMEEEYWRVENASSEQFASGIDKSLTLDLKNVHNNKVRVKKINIIGEVDYTVISDTVTVSVPDAVSRDILQVLRDIDDAKKLETAFEKRAEESVFHYTFKSEVEFAVGDQLELSNSALNILTNVVVLDRVFTYDNDVLIWEYECEGSAEISDLVGQVTQPTLIGTRPSDQQLRSMQRQLDDTLDEDGYMKHALSSNAIEGPEDEDGTKLPFIPMETALFMTDEYLGFYDADAGEWVAYMRNDDGVGKMRVGDDDHNMEWDGAELYVRGAANIDGTITAGSGIVSDDYDPGNTGWQIKGDGDAEFNDVTVRGAVEADTGEIGNWIIDTPDLRDSDNRLFLRPDKRRFEVRDSSDVIKIALGYLDGIKDFGSADYGLYIAEGNNLSIEGGGDYSDGDYLIESDAAYVIKDSNGDEIGRFGALGSGDVGFFVGLADSDDEGIKYSLDDRKLTVRGGIDTQSVNISDDGITGQTTGGFRTYITGTKVALQTEESGEWTDRATIGGDPGARLPDIMRSQGLAKIGADLTDLDVGDEAPSGSTRFNFDDTYADKNGNDPWDFKDNTAFTTNSKFGSHALTASSGEARLVNSGASIEVASDFSLALWHYDSLLPSSGEDLVTMRGGGAESWTEIRGGGASTWNGVAGNAEYWMVVSNGGDIRRSTDDGQNFDSVHSHGSLLTSIHEKDGTWITVGDNGDILRSTDGGDSWSTIATPVSERLYGIHCDSETGTWIACGNKGTVLRSTDDGNNWTDVGNPLDDTFTTLWDIAGESGTWLAVGENAEIIRSTDDGQSWSSTSNDETINTLRGVFVSESTWITVGNDGAFRSTNNGDSWSTTSTTSSLYDVIKGSGIWYAVGHSSSIRSTNDGDSWTSISQSSSFDAEEVAHALGTWLVVGDESTIDRSTGIYAILRHDGNGSLQLEWDGEDVTASREIGISSGWNYTSVHHDVSAGSLQLVVNDSTSSTMDISADSGSSVTLALELRVPSPDYRHDDLLIMPDSLLSTSESIEHFESGFPWAESDYGLDLFLAPKSGGQVKIVDPSDGSSAPIVESGSNSDGEWTRWADGTQHCWWGADKTGPPSVWTYPKPFSDLRIIPIVENLGGNTQATSVQVDLSTTEMEPVIDAGNFTMMAIGRWK